MKTTPKRTLEKAIATASFVVAVALAFTSMLISDDNDIAANACLAIAQFLTLTATLLGIDYKFNSYGKNITAGAEKQQPLEHKVE